MKIISTTCLSATFLALLALAIAALSWSIHHLGLLPMRGMEWFTVIIIPFLFLGLIIGVALYAECFRRRRQSSTGGVRASYNKYPVHVVKKGNSTNH